MNPRAIMQAAKILRNVGPKKMGKVAVDKAIASTLVPMTYDKAPRLLLWTLANKPQAAKWAIANNRAVWEHPKHGMDILMKLDDMIVSGRSAKEVSKYGNQMKRMARMNTQIGNVRGDNMLDRVDVIHDVAKTRDPIYRGLFGLTSVHQKGKNPLYLGLEKAVKSKGATPVQFNPANQRGRDLLAEAQFLAKAKKNEVYNHTVMGHFGADKRNFWDVWDFAQNNPQKMRQLQKDILENAFSDPLRSAKDIKEMTTRYLREVLNSRINPLRIEGPVI